MVITTNHNIGDTFWQMQDNRPKAFIVDNIYIHILEKRHDDTLSQPRIELAVCYESNIGKREQVQDSLFYPTKEALFESL